MGPFNIANVRSQHSRFIGSVGTIVDTSAQEAASFGARHRGHTFKTNSADGLNASVKTRVVRTRQGNRIILSSNKPHTMAQEFGSGIHASRGTRAKYPIRPRRAKALRWVSNGVVHFSRGVMHPGVRPTRWLFRKAEAAGAHEYNLLRQRLDALVARS